MNNITDTDEGEAALPWGMGYEISAIDYPLDKWVSIEIPLSKLSTGGAWSDVTEKWYASEGKFDWNRLEKLQLYFNDYDNAMSDDIYIDDVVIKQK